MMKCERCRAALLDKQYGLLDSAAAASLDEHLAGCPACQAEQLKLERFGRLLSSAARTEFPDFRFVAPADRQTTLGYSTEGSRLSRLSRAKWTQWIVAAAVLLAVGIPVAGHLITTHSKEAAVQSAMARYDELDRQRRDARAKHHSEIDKLQTSVKESNAAWTSAEMTLATKLNEVQKDLLARQLTFSISGPAAPQAGAPAEYQIHVRDNAGRATPATVGYKVKDQSNRTVYEGLSQRTKGDLTARLPADLPLKPDSDLYLEVTAQREDGTHAQLREQLKLAAPVYFTHLATDKPMYQPGEVVRFRSLTLDRASLKPAETPLNLQYFIRDPLGAETLVASGIDRVSDLNSKPMNGPDGKPIQGIGAAEWTIPADARGGEYTLVVRESSNRFPGEQRRFIVNQYHPAQLNKELEWSKKSYGPGEEVVANCKVTNAAGPVAFQPVTVEVFVDGQPVPAKASGPTNSDGTVAVRFALPKVIERGEGSLSVQFTDGGNRETLSKPIPIALKKLNVEFFAEGGDLVAGVPNRVYFQAHSTLGKPVDIRGRIVDEAGRVVAEAETLTDELEPGINQGMGRFDFTPEFGQKYKLEIDRPIGAEGEYKLPVVQADGVSLRALSEVSSDPDPIRIRVTSPNVARNLLVGAYARGRLLDHQRITAAANQSIDVALKPEAGIGGVTRVTIFEELPGENGRKTLRPRAERLVFRKPAARLTLSVDPDKSRYVPGDHVGLSIRSINEKNEPTPAIAMIGVVNKSVVTMADEKTWRSMPTHFLLTSEVEKPEDLEHADVLLGTHPKAAEALDLLLGTQGWRRFAEQNAAPPADKKVQDGEKIMLAFARPQRITTDALTISRQKVTGELAPTIELAKEKAREAEVKLEQARSDRAFAEQEQKLTAEMTLAHNALKSAKGELSATLAWRNDTLRWMLPTACALFLLIAFLTLFAGIWRGARYYIATATSLGLAGAAAVMLALNVGHLDRDAQPVALADGGAIHANPIAAPSDAMPGQDADRMSERLGADPDPAKAKGHEDAAFRFGGAMPKNNPAIKPGDGGAVKPDVRMLRGAIPAPAQPDAPIPQAAAAPAAPRPMARGAANVNESKTEAGKAAGAGGDAKNAEGRKLFGNVKAHVEPQRRNAIADEKRLEKDAGNGRMKQQLARPAGDDLPLAVPGPGGGGGGRGGFAADGIQMRKMRELADVPPAPQPFIVREFAHKHAASASGDRADFAETVFWSPVLVLPQDGGTVHFDLGDDVTRYQVLVVAHTLDGRLGSTETMIEARKPFSVEPKLPIEVTSSDRIDIPVTLANDTYEPRAVSVIAQPVGLTLSHGDAVRKATLAPEQRSRQVFQLKSSLTNGTAELRLTGKSDGFGDDQVVRKISVVPDGFPIIGSFSDMLEGVVQHEIVLPETWVPGTLKCRVNVYPSTLAELQKGLEGLLREPGGCFEQTSTTNYPNALVLQYLKESDQANPAAMKQAKSMLERGYAKLTAFEVPTSGSASAPRGREGFEWFGQAPAHEALTAYGLMQFRDMATVTDVDPQLLARTRNYLMSRRDGKGGFTRNPLALDSFGRAPEPVTNAYIIWALTEGSRDDDVTQELNRLAEQAKTNADPYFLALVANCLLNRDRVDEAMVILQKLASKLTKDGYLEGAATSITGSAGRTLEIETTALAVLGWLKANRPAEFTQALRSAVGWIGRQRGGFGDFGSTQSTILALKALIAYTKANKKTSEAGELSLSVGHQKVGKIAFAAGTQGALTIDVPNAERQLKPGKNDIRIEITGKNNFPYTLTWTYQTLQPPNAEGCAVKLMTGLDRTELNEGEIAHLNVHVENVSGKGQGMTVAIIGIPAGLKLPDDFAQLKDLAKLRDNGTKPGKIGAFEVRGRELVLYWRDIAPDAKIDLNLDLRAHVPGAYHGPASRSYLYYNPDSKYWVPPLEATVRVKE